MIFHIIHTYKRKNENICQQSCYTRPWTSWYFNKRSEVVLEESGSKVVLEESGSKVYVGRFHPFIGHKGP
jgi:hypothetical protein